MSTPSAGPAVRTERLAKRYGRTVALEDLSMTVERGEVFGFLGPNGAGKTTAVKVLLGLARPSRGRAELLGRRLGDRDVRARIGYLPELFRYQAWLRGREVLELHARLARHPADRTPKNVEEVLGLVGLADRAESFVGTYSKGMQQRLGLAAALLGRPDLVFLDEPTSALDPVGRLDVRTIIRRARERGTTVFLNSHLLTEVERVCDRVAIVDGGKVIAAGRLDELLGRPALTIRAAGVSAEALMALAAFGPVEVRDDRLRIDPIDPARVPDVVAALVAKGARIQDVDAGRGSLEDHFIALVSGGRAPGPAGPADTAGPARPAGPDADDATA
ncbi:MAG TPA: ABC transporter ATP-binding protein [Candidatus Limnocylindrales bacterium]